MTNCREKTPKHGLTGYEKSLTFLFDDDKLGAVVIFLDFQRKERVLCLGTSHRPLFKSKHGRACRFNGNPS
jgi:hypothetical protein